MISYFCYQVLYIKGALKVLSKYHQNKKIIHGLVALMFATALGGSVSSVVAKNNQTTVNQSGVFDYYLLSLSWSPDFCASHNDPNQCAIGKKQGFVLHGLWPQFARGYPQSCANIPLTSVQINKYASIFASPKLIYHEWSKHGTCSGLAPEEYLNLTQQVKDKLHIPSKYQQPTQPIRTTILNFKKDFSSANPGLPEGAVAPSCSGSGRFLAEVRICLNKTATQYQACSSDALRQSEKSCGQKDFLIRNVK